MVKQSIFYALLIAYSNDNYTKNIIFFLVNKVYKTKKKLIVKFKNVNLQILQ